MNGFPTIYFLRKDDKTQPILFNAPRKFSSLLKFVAEKSTSPLKNYDRKGISQVMSEISACFTLNSWFYNATELHPNLFQSYLLKDRAPTYSDTEERLKINLKEGFQKKRIEASLNHDEL